jgi:phosphotriesterase-related protein
LRRISEATGLNIVAGCGWYRGSFMEPEIDRMSTEQMAEMLIFEIEHGLDGTNVRPGILGEVGVEVTHRHLSPREERCTRAMAKAHKRTGLAVTTHLPMGHIAFEMLDVLGDHGVPPERVILGHCSFYLDLSYHHELIKRGAYLQFDIFGMKAYARDEPEVLRHVVSLILEGYADHILLSHDICARSQLKHYGGNGFDYIATNVIPRLKEARVGEEAIHTIVVENPKRVLAV